MCETIETGKTHETFEKVIVAIIVTVATTEIATASGSDSQALAQYPVYFESDEMPCPSRWSNETTLTRTKIPGLTYGWPVFMPTIFWPFLYREYENIYNSNTRIWEYNCNTWSNLITLSCSSKRGLHIEVARDPTQPSSFHLWHSIIWWWWWWWWWWWSNSPPFIRDIQLNRPQIKFNDFSNSDICVGPTHSSLGD